MTSTSLRITLGLGAVLAITLGLNAQQGPKTARYNIIDIGTLGGANSFAYSNNNSGMVAGGSNTTGQNSLTAQTAILWYGGQPVNLGTLGGSACPGCSSQGAAATANGSVAVISETASLDPNGEDFCEFGTHHQCLAAVWRNGQLTALQPLPGGNNSEVYFANNSGEMVGVSEIGTPDATCAMPFQVRRYQAAKWSPAGIPTALIPLPQQNDEVSFAFSNNNHGQAVGISGKCSNVMLPPFYVPSAPHAVLWQADGTPLDLGTPSGGAGDNVAVNINNKGQVTVNSVMTDGTVRAFLWSGGALQQLKTYPADSIMTFVPCCNNLNDRGQMTGVSIDSSFNLHALYWESADQDPIDLNEIAPQGSPWFLTFPGGINEAGEIATNGVNLNTFESHGLVLRPMQGVGPAARGAIKPPASLRNLAQKISHH